MQRNKNFQTVQRRLAGFEVIGKTMQLQMKPTADVIAFWQIHCMPTSRSTVILLNLFHFLEALATEPINPTLVDR